MEGPRRRSSDVDWRPAGGEAGDDGGEAVPAESSGQGWTRQVVVRVGSGERSLADPIWPPQSVVPGRCDG